MDQISLELQHILKQPPTGSVDLLDRTMEEMDPDESHLLRLCAIPHYFDQEILRVLKSDLTEDKLLQTHQAFSTLPFVKQFLDVLEIDRVVRQELFNRWFSTEPHPEFVAASKRLFEYFDREVREGAEELEDKQFSRLFHQIGFDPRAGFAEFENLFDLKHRQFNLTKCEQLIKLVREYYLILREGHRNSIDYREGLLAVDRRQHEKAEAIFLEVLDRKLDPQLHVQVLSQLGGVYARDRKWKKALSQFQTAHALAEKTSTAANLRWLINHDLAIAYRESGNIDKAEKLLQDNIIRARENDNSSLVAAGFNSLGTLFRQIGNCEKAKKHYLESLNSVGAKDTFRLAQIYNNLALTYLEEKEWAEAERFLLKSIGLKHAASDFIGEGKSLNNLARVYQQKGDHDRAIQTLDDAITSFSKAHDFRSVAEVRWNFAKLARGRGNSRESNHALEEAAKLFERGQLFNEAEYARQEKVYLQPRGGLSTIGVAFEIYRRNFATILFPFLFILPFALLRDYVLATEVESSKTLEYVANSLGIALYFCILLFVLPMITTIMISMICLGKRASLRLSISWINQHLVQRVFSTYLIVGGLLFAGLYAVQLLWAISNRITVSLLLLLAGVLSILTFYAFTMFLPCVVTLERQAGMAAIRRSRDLGRRFYLRNVCISLLATAPAWLIYFVLVLVQTFSFNFIPEDIRRAGLLENTIMTLIAPIGIITTMLLYYEMRVRKEDYDFRLMADELAV
jgi:tetratricopeptide (TPR) repeat protein